MMRRRMTMMLMMMMMMLMMMTAEDDLQAACWWSLLLIATSSMMMPRIPDKQLPCLDSSVGDDANDDADESCRPWAGWKPLQPALQRIQTNDCFVWSQSWVDEDHSGKTTYVRQLIPSFAATANAKEIRSNIHCLVLEHRQCCFSRKLQNAWATSCDDDDAVLWRWHCESGNDEDADADSDAAAFAANDAGYNDDAVLATYGSK